MKIRAIYSQYMDDQNVEGSGRAASYVRALDLLGPILAKHGSKFPDCSDVWEVQTVERIAALYTYILEQQRLGETGIFKGETPSSYWRDRYCSAALKSYKEFLILHPYEQRLWDLINQPDVKPTELAKRLSAEEVDSIEELVSECDIDFSTREGKEKLREVKTRINQGFFRKLVLKTYGTQCCVTGLNFPDVLRASHIVAWSDDEKNRMNPANGLCLSATYDAAFDKHLISFDEDFRMIFSPQLKEFYSNEAFKTQFLAFEGRRIALPKRFCPDQTFLEKHRAKIPA
jgi:putative restriction endonuclease